MGPSRVRGMIVFRRYWRDGYEKRQEIEIWPKDMTVATMLYHPKHEKRTKMYRQHVDIDTLKSLFDNPRQHTTGGYMTRRGKQHGKVTRVKK